jgi:erythromycin esterase
MKLLQGLLALSLLAPPAAAAAEAPDPRVAWLREHAVALATVDPAAPDLDDLAPLEEALAGARVVLLGEATRGDGSAFLAKARLVRFLHERMGFDVLALECGVLACDRAWREIRAGGEPAAALTGALLPLYAESEQFRPVLDLVAARRGSARPLVVAGFDAQVGAGAEGTMAELGRVLRRLGSDPAGVPGFDAAAAVVRRVAEEAYATGAEPVPSKAERARFAATLEEIRRRLRTPAPEGAEAGPPPDEEELDLWRRHLDNLAAAARMAWELGVYRPGLGVPAEVTNIGHRQAAENLLWLLSERYPGRKVVVWWVTVHLARDLHRLETGDLDTKARLERFVTVGDLLDEALGEEVYALGVTAFQGHAGNPFQAPYALLQPTPGSFEELMGRTGLEAAFVDLRGLRKAGRPGRWLAGPLIARPLSYLELRGSWPRHLDGLLFLRTLEPSRPAGR